MVSWVTEMDAADAEAVFLAYRTGLLRKPQRDSGSKSSFHRLVALVVCDRFPLRQRAALRRVERASWQGLCAAREGDAERAVRAFETGQQELERAWISPECRLLGSSVLESAWAYLEYREGRLEQARRRAFSAMNADSFLEQDEAYSVLELHRIQAAHNLMRIDLRAGEPERALALAGDIFGYLEGQLDSLPVHGPWRQKAIWQAPRILRRTMIAQVANEAAVALLGFVGNEGWLALHRRVRPWLNACRSGIHPRVLQWLKLKEALASEDWQSYLVLLRDILPAGREDIPSIWYSCVLDLLEFCQVQGPQYAHISTRILRDAVKWPAVPPVLRSCLNRYGGPAA